MKQFYILRDVSGSGKSTFAETLLHYFKTEADCFGGPKPVHLEADKYWYDAQGNYNFDVNKIQLAHGWCQAKVKEAMSLGCVVIVSNTTTKKSEIKIYLDLAKKYGYNVTSLVIENRHGNKDVHNVPEETLQRQEHNLRNSLKLR